MSRPVAFFEIMSTDPDRARKFYRELFSWTGEPDPELGGYTLLDTGAGEDALGGGIGEAHGANRGVKIYIKVENVDEELARANELGAPTLAEPRDLPGGYGRIAVFADPDGNPVGLWG